MNSSTLMDHVNRFADRLCREEVNLHGFLFSVAGKTVAAAFRPPFRADRPHRLYSVSKTLTGIAVGLLADDGKLSLDDPVASFFPDWLPASPSGYLLRLTVRDMLRMATCYRRTAYREREDENWAKAFFTGTPDHEPGTVFSYDTGCSQVLAALVRRLSGQEVMDFLEDRLFRPLGCEDRRYWLRDPSSCCQGGTGLCMSLRDLHRVGLCLLEGGKGLVPAWYVREMSRKQIETVLQEKEEEQYGYGWQCWITRSGWAMYGMGGQLSVLCPEKQALLSTVADTRLDPFGVQRIYDAFFEELWPFIEPDQMPDDLTPQTLCLPSLALKDGGGRFPAGGTYLFPEENELGLRELSLGEAEVVLTRGSGTARVPFCRGEVLETAFPGHPDVPALITAAVPDDGLLRVRCDAIGDAPCGFDLLISLKEDRVTVKSRRSFDPLTDGYDGIASGSLRKGGAS